MGCLAANLVVVLAGIHAISFVGHSILATLAGISFSVVQVEQRLYTSMTYPSMSAFVVVSLKPSFFP